MSLSVPVAEISYIMLHDIKVARQLGADGVVFGCLTAEGYVDVPLMQKLMNAVGEMSVTFHRAFDMCSNPKEALEQICLLYTSPSPRD